MPLRGVLTALLLIARASHAQRVESTLDVGGALLRYADTLTTGAATVMAREREKQSRMDGSISRVQPARCSWALELVEHGTQPPGEASCSGKWAVQSVRDREAR